MLIDMYPLEDMFAPMPGLATQIDPILQVLDGLSEGDDRYQQVRVDLGKRYHSTLAHGRHSIPMEVLLRMPLLKHLFGWRYQKMEDHVDESVMLHWFSRLYWEATPDDTTLLRWANTLHPEMLHVLNDQVVELARQARVTQGRKLQLDATCVQTMIHHPTDGGLFVDSVRVLSRFVKHAKELVVDQVRSAKRMAQTLHRQLRRKGEDKEAEQKKLYQKLVETARSSAEAVLKRVIAQTHTRVLEGKKASSGHKVLSLFEPHTRAIPRHIRRSAGRVWSAGDPRRSGERYRDALRVLEHPNEHGQAVEAVAHYVALFDDPLAGYFKLVPEGG